MVSFLNEDCRPVQDTCAVHLQFPAGLRSKRDGRAGFRSQELRFGMRTWRQTFLIRGAPYSAAVARLSRSEGILLRAAIA
jgi:hypothetical protein